MWQKQDSFFTKTASYEWLEKDFTKKAINGSKIQSGLPILCLIKACFLEVVKL